MIEMQMTNQSHEVNGLLVKIEKKVGGLMARGESRETEVPALIAEKKAKSRNTGAIAGVDAINLHHVQKNRHR